MHVYVYTCYTHYTHILLCLIRLFCKTAFLSTLVHLQSSEGKGRLLKKHHDHTCMCKVCIETCLYMYSTSSLQSAFVFTTCVGFRVSDLSYNSEHHLHCMLTSNITELVCQTVTLVTFTFLVHLRLEKEMIFTSTTVQE